MFVFFFFSFFGVHFFFFFFSSRRRHTRSLRDWSSDVCSSDLCPRALAAPRRESGDRCADPFGCAGHASAGGGGGPGRGPGTRSLGGTGAVGGVRATPPPAARAHPGPVAVARGHRRAGA